MPKVRANGIDIHYEIIGSGLESSDPISHAVSSREHDHGDIGGDRICAELAADLVAVHIGHHDVE